MAKRTKATRIADSASCIVKHEMATESRKNGKRFMVGQVLAVMQEGAAVDFIRVGSKYRDALGREWCFHDKSALAYPSVMLRPLTKKESGQ